MAEKLQGILTPQERMEKDLGKFLSLFDEDGKRLSSVPIDQYLSLADYTRYLREGYIVISREDWQIYCDQFGGENGTGYLRDAETGKPVPAPPHIPTQEERAELLHMEYEPQMEAMNNDLILAQAEGDTELLKEILDERRSIMLEYQQKMEDIQNGV